MKNMNSGLKKDATFKKIGSKLALLIVACLTAVILLVACETSEGEHVHSYGEWTVVSQATCTEAGLEERSCACNEKETREIPSGHVEAEDGRCSLCGEIMNVISLRYDDYYNVQNMNVEVVDAGTPTSYMVGYGVADGTLDSAVVKHNGKNLVATGIGTATVRIDGKLYVDCAIRMDS